MTSALQMPAPKPGSVLLFHIESADGCFDQHEIDSLDDLEIHNFRTLLSAKSSFESKVERDVKRFTEMVMREEGKLDIVVLAVKLVGVGYRVSIRRAVGGGSGQECFRNLSYEFLLVGYSERDSLDTSELVVDPKFREQFTLSQQTDRYTQVMELLPAAFVGSQARLAALVRALSNEMESAFSKTGITMPPWRQTNSMLSKWRPVKAKDKEILLNGEVNSSRVEGDSPRDHLSLCSSRSSSTSSDGSPERGRFLTEGIQRQASVPKRIQSGFCVNSPICGTVLEDELVNGGSIAPGREFCVFCALNSENNKRPLKTGPWDRFERDKSTAMGVERSEKLGLAKIRTVRPIGGR